MGSDIHEIKIHQSKQGYWVIYINGEFYRTTDSYGEMFRELQKVCKR